MTGIRFSVITPVFKPVLKELRECLRSAKGLNVEHILALDGLSSIENLESLRRLAKKFNAKLVISPDQVGISAASNLAVSESTGDFLVFLDQDDFFEEGWCEPLRVEAPQADLIYSDAFLADLKGRITGHSRKPDWSPLRLYGNMFAVHFMAIRKTIFDQVGGFRSQFDGSQDHDLALRVSRITERVVHIPLPLYAWRASGASTSSNPANKSWAFEAGVLASREHLSHFDKEASAESVEGYPGAIRAIFKERSLPVSIVVPTAFSCDFSGLVWAERLFLSLKPFLRPEIGDEIIFVHGEEDDLGFISRAREQTSLQILSVKDANEFNFSRRVNIGFFMAKNDHVLLLNDDVRFGSQNPFNQLFGLLRLPKVGLVGALLMFPDGSIQHGGHIFVDGSPGHFAYGEKHLSHGVFDLIVDREVAGVTGALMFQLKSTWLQVGGFTMSLPLSFNDVDYCLKVRSLGHTVIQANSVSAIHNESVTREPVVESDEHDFIKGRWSDAMATDCFSSPYK